MAAHGATAPAELTPVVRSRLAAINGASIAQDERARREDAWYLTREYVLTWAKEPPGHNTVVAGRWWTPEEAAREPLISVEEEIARQLGVKLGGTLTFDIQGVTVTARVVNLRQVDWRSLNTNFFVIFSQGALDGAPTTLIATAGRAPSRRPGSSPRSWRPSRTSPRSRSARCSSASAPCSTRSRSRSGSWRA